MHLSRLCSQSFGLGVGLFTKSRNNTMYQSRENWFLGEKSDCLAKNTFLGENAEGEDADYWRHFLSLKKPLFSHSGFKRLLLQTCKNQGLFGKVKIQRASLSG